MLHRCKRTERQDNRAVGRIVKGAEIMGMSRTEYRKERRTLLKQIFDKLWIINQMNDTDLERIKRQFFINLDSDLGEIIKKVSYGDRLTPDNHVYIEKEEKINVEYGITTDIKTHVIDTVFTIDTGEWETGIKPKNNVWIIVEQYGDSEIKAKKGHDKWVEKLKKNPKLELKDVMSYGF
jgi:hypothetical protein